MLLAACQPAPSTFEELAASRLPQIEGTIDLPSLQGDVEDYPVQREAGRGICLWGVGRDDVVN
jgi:hypothetical protein